MAKTATPIFGQDPRHSSVTISTANTNRDGTGTIGTAFTADATDGSVVTKVVIQATGTTTAGVVRLYIHNGSTAFMVREVLVPAITPSTSISAFRREINAQIELPAGWSLRASTHNAESFNIHAFGFDF